MFVVTNVFSVVSTELAVVTNCDRQRSFHKSHLTGKA